MNDALDTGAQQETPEASSEPWPEHLHSWDVLGVQSHTPWVALGKPTMHTIVLIRCSECGEPDTRMIPGEWTMEQLRYGPGTDGDQDDGSDGPRG